VRAFFAISLANLAAILAWDLARSVPWAGMLNDSLWGLTSALFATAVAFGLLPLVEQVFRLTSDITLLELSDLNRPLLRRMQLEAPGTYHHSMVVGSLAESAAEAIGPTRCCRACRPTTTTSASWRSPSTTPRTNRPARARGTRSSRRR
jgi:membrane-associated HD superfamily phosphohydrolase